MDVKFTPEQILDTIYNYNMSGGQLAASSWFTILYKSIPNIINADDINFDILNDLKEIGFKTMYTRRNYNSKVKLPIIQTQEYQNALFNTGGNWNLTYTHKTLGNFFVDIECHAVKNTNENTPQLCDIRFLYDKNTLETINFIYEIIRNHECKTRAGSIAILIKNNFGELTFRSFQTNVPSTINLNINYGPNFNDTHNKIINKLDNISSGLYIFHGEPGTGKSTYIKYLSTVLPHKKFVYIPEFMLHMLSNPEVIQLCLNEKNMVMVIEDAEKIIQKRDIANDNSIVSSLLNFTDGILSDIIKMPIIITYNTDSGNIDEALLRKGRLQYKHEFSLLPEKSVIKLLSQNNVSKNKIDDLQKWGIIKNQMSLADIYNIFDDIGTKAKEKFKIGF